ncbi:MAG: alpha/beta hydrolase [Actinomycetota bacterium]
MTSDRFPTSTVADVDGASLHAYVMGAPTDRPSVVFEAGIGGFGAQWCHIQPLVAERTLTVSYDRAGLGQSDRGLGQRTPEVIGDELAALLSALMVEPPYVLVGHSLGGLLMRCFAGRRQDDVAGLVLVDASHEQQMTRARIPGWMVGVTRLTYRIQAGLAGVPRLGRVIAARGVADGRRGMTQAQWDRCVALASRTERFRTMQSETAHFDRLFGLDHGVPTDFADLPLRVVTAGESMAGTSRRLNAQHQRNQADLVQLSTNGSQVTVAGATHLSILLDRQHAATVADAILSVT